MISEGFIAIDQQHLGKNSGLVNDEELNLTSILAFYEIRKVVTHFFALFRNQNVEKFNVLG
jgi:hypothetical protein